MNRIPEVESALLDPSEEMIEAMADCLLKQPNIITREEIIAGFRAVAAKLPKPKDL